jgi:DNA-binding response OmpR family regulator
MQNRQILLVDDDPFFILAMTAILEEGGYTVTAAADGHAAMQAICQHRPDLVILDIGLPDINGIALCQMIRLQASKLPIVFLTGHQSHHDLLAGFDAGADDYITKPCDADELLARVRAVLNRSARGPVAPGEVLEAGEVTLNAARHEVLVRGQQVELSPKEFNLLWLLVANAGRVVPRTVILDSVWGADFYGDVKALDVYIRILRPKIERAPDHPRLIETVRGVGYAFASQPPAPLAYHQPETAPEATA